MPINIGYEEFFSKEAGQTVWQFSFSKEAEAILRHVMGVEFGLLSQPEIKTSKVTGDLLVSFLEGDARKFKFKDLVLTRDGAFQVAVLNHNAKESLNEGAK